MAREGLRERGIGEGGSLTHRGKSSEDVARRRRETALLQRVDLAIRATQRGAQDPARNDSLAALDPEADPIVGILHGHAGWRFRKPPPPRTPAHATVVQSNTYDCVNDFSGPNMGTFAST